MEGHLTRVTIITHTLLQCLSFFLQHVVHLPVFVERTLGSDRENKRGVGGLLCLTSRTVHHFNVSSVSPKPNALLLQDWEITKHTGTNRSDCGSYDKKAFDKPY